MAKVLGVIVLITLFLTASLTLAQEPVSPGEDDTPTDSFLETITVTATRGETDVMDAPGTVSVIDAERIEQEVANDIRDLVRYEPGVYVDNSAERLGPGGVNIRGVGGNRVLTLIDGIPAAEEFAFGRFEMPSFAIDLDAVGSVEILRGPASSLYGSDALGGVVSFASRDPVDYLGSDAFYLGLRGGWDGRFDQLGGALTLAVGGDRWHASGVLTYADAAERDNQGDVRSEDASRTAPNPQERRQLGLLTKLTHEWSPSRHFELAYEALERVADTRLLSSQGLTDLGAIFGFAPPVTWLIDKPRVEGSDEQARRRVSLEHSAVAWLTDHLLWRVYGKSSDSTQHTDEIRSTTLGGGPFGPLTTVDILREGLMTFEQETRGAEAVMQQGFELGGAQLLTFGVLLQRDDFDQLRDRVQTDVGTGDPAPSADGLIFPTRYFPESRAVELGAFVQAQIGLAGGRLTLVPGVRYDSSDLSVDESDLIYLNGNEGAQPPVEPNESAVSPRLGALFAIGGSTVLHSQYAHGFRAPPYSAVNSGFTHLAGGVTRLPNSDLRPETSDGFEVGLRSSGKRGAYSLTAYTTRYEDFIELQTLGLNPATGLIEFQERNVARAEIYGAEAAAEVPFGKAWKVRSALSWSRGKDLTRSEPLNSVHPPELVVGLRHDWARADLTTELVGRYVASKSHDDIDSSQDDQFATPSYRVVDLLGGWRFGGGVTVNAGLLNIFDETYWNWTDAIGRLEGSPTLDRFTGTGRSITVALRYRTR